MNLQNHSIHAWIVENQIKTEAGLPLDFRDHMFMFDVYRDYTPVQAVMKAAQITASTCFSLKVPWVVKNRRMDAIYTLPTESDRNAFVSGKVNRIIAQNPVLQGWTKDKDSIEQKQIGDNLVHYRGTWTQKAAIMVPSDLNVYDEIDASKQDVIEQYATRLQHSSFKWEWYLSHPSADNFGVDRVWKRSDQKHWFVKCTSCNSWQFLEWPNSIDFERKVFICKHCNVEVTNQVRRNGKWVKKSESSNISGYWIPLLICPWVSASELIEYSKTKSEEYFTNKVLGLPYVGSGNKLTRAMILANLKSVDYLPNPKDTVVIGVDTGTKLYIVAGTKRGLFHNEIAKDYDAVEQLMDRYPKSIAVIDQGGDLIGSRKLRERYRGRVYLCSFGTDRKTLELVRWGTGDEDGNVIADRNRMIQLVVSEFSDKRIPLYGSELDWNEFIINWENLSRVKEYDDKTGDIKRQIWVKTGDSDLSFATVYWRIGMSRFMYAGEGGIIGLPNFLEGIDKSPTLNADGTVPAPDPKKIFIFESKSITDWRNT